MKFELVSKGHRTDEEALLKRSHTCGDPMKVFISKRLIQTSTGNRHFFRVIPYGV